MTGMNSTRRGQRARPCNSSCPLTILSGLPSKDFHPIDQAVAASETVEIADITLYYGKRATFKDADRVNIVQFKYSISKKDSVFRASDAKETIIKFAAAYLDHKKRHGATKVREKAPV